MIGSLVNVLKAHRAVSQRESASSVLRVRTCTVYRVFVLMHQNVFAVF